jgi:RNA polymerase sigma factor (sigma-70 family)
MTRNYDNIEFLFRDRYKLYLRVATNLCHDTDTAKDVVSAAFLHILSYKKEIIGIERCSKFIVHIIKQRWYNIYRTEMCEKSHLEKLSMEPFAVQPDGIALYPIATAVTQKINQLPKTQQIVIKATYWEGLNWKEIEACYNINYRTVPHIRSRALQRLMRCDPSEDLRGKNPLGKGRNKPVSKETLSIVGLVNAGHTYPQIAGMLNLPLHKVRQRFYHYQKIHTSKTLVA